MSEEVKRTCVVLPCVDGQTWVVPQNCLAEIVTVQGAQETPPTEVEWRGQAVPLLEIETASGQSWREDHFSAGLVAVLLGLQDQGCEYWGVALRSEGPGMMEMDEAEMEDKPDAMADHSTAAFEYQGVIYQVPDLLELQQQMAEAAAAA